MENDCIICSPDKDNLVLRETRGVVLLDDPVRTGHVLVGASVHADGLHAISADVAGDVLSLARDVAATIVEQTGAEKVYVAAVGDKDKHFHVHLVPRYGDDPGLGPFIFGDSGWVGSLSPDPSNTDWPHLLEQLKSR